MPIVPADLDGLERGYDSVVNIRRGIRSKIKWGGVVITVLLLIVWVGSKWVAFGAKIEGMPIYVNNGRLIVHDPKLAPQYRRNAIIWIPTGGPPSLSLWFGRDAAGTITTVPVWFLAILAITPTLLMWWRDQRQSLPGTCPKCGYSRTGLPVDRACPECGSAVK